MIASKWGGSQKSSGLLVGVCALLLLTAGTLMNLWFGRATLEIVRDQFNEEQLAVARNIRYWVEKQLGFLEKELRLASENLEGQIVASHEINLRLDPTFDRVMELGVSRIQLHDPLEQVTYSYYPHNRQMTIAQNPETDPADRSDLPSGSTVLISEPIGNGSEQHLNLNLAMDGSAFDRLSFQLNLSWFLSPLLKSIRSGKTGYAWILDGRGRFVFHPQSDFIGQSAFIARQDRAPDFSHHEINAIQRDNMLKGREGTGSYHSTWHRGTTGNIEKLIAYTPLIISDSPAQTWSVAVVAPVFEIEAAVRNIHRWQALLQVLIVIMIIAAGAAVLGSEIKWSRRLEKIVESRTTALKRSEENYRSLIESAEDFIFTLDKDGRLMSVNNFTAAFFGSRPEELIGAGIEQLFTDEIADRQIKIIGNVFEKGKSVRDECELIGDDVRVWISANFMPLKDDTGRMSAVLCIARDITENKKLERSLIHTEKLASLGTLAAGVAHEINNPLGVILGFCDLLVRKKETGSQEYEDLKIIERQGMHCKQIVENLLSFARVGQEITSDADVNACLEEIIKVVHHSLEMKAIELQTVLAANLPRVNGDNRRLQQVFINLINNAAAAMPEGGLLEIRSMQAAGTRKVAVQIRDQGSGIPPEILDHIYEPFFTTKPEGEGTGLGLFVSYGIIHQFGGTITCESQTGKARDKAKGTTFTVELTPSKEEEKWRVEF